MFFTLGLKAGFQVRPIATVQSEAVQASAFNRNWKNGLFPGEW